MKIKNLTNKIQHLWIKNPREGNVSFSVEVRPSVPRDITDYLIDRSMMPDFDEKFAIVGADNQTVSTPKETIEVAQTVEETPVEEETQTPAVEETQEPAPEIIEDKFICKICGAEFASQRGLNSHMNRSHPDNG